MGRARTGRAGRRRGPSLITPRPVRVLAFGTYQRDYPRNAQVRSCLRGAGVDVVEQHAGVLDWRRAGWSAGLTVAARLVRAEVRLARRPTPEADLLRDKIYELRVGLQGQNYRILYFFHGTTAAVLAHGLVKERAVPPAEIDLAIKRRERFEADPETHTYVGAGGSNGKG